MTLGEIIETSSKRGLERDTVESFCMEETITLPAFCDRFARTVAHCYASNEREFEFCDGAINNLYAFMIASCIDTLPDYAFSVFLAFDEGEYHHRNDPCDADPGEIYTRPQIAKLIAAEQNA